MSRNGKVQVRRLAVGDETFLWSLRHKHHVEQGRTRDCREVLSIRRIGTRGRLLIIFREGPGLLAPGFPGASGTVATRGSDGCLNLNEPGTVRALLDEATASGWQPEDPSTREADGWLFFDTVAARRGKRADAPVRPVPPLM